MAALSQSFRSNYSLSHPYLHISFRHSEREELENAPFCERSNSHVRVPNLSRIACFQDNLTLRRLQRRWDWLLSTQLDIEMDDY
ncbi:hypothetical protein AVEN_150215-1 [Araneus ventricosus]|uniref:Uncharacterized protein n=1 Tax=Araneus ventricosus TaxID=182803 RepID=A0A4Y2QHX5_ARAVE|nr:hypothetical protein AVEN_150215-1 [Araneus ventricosus]